MKRVATGFLIVMVTALLAACQDRVIWDDQGGSERATTDREIWNSQGKIDSGERRIWYDKDGKPIIK